MRFHHLPALVLPLIAVAACSRGPEPQRDEPVDANAAAAAAPAKPVETSAAPALMLAENGLLIRETAGGSAQLLGFGARQDAALRALSPRSAPAITELSECGAGPLTAASWPDGLTLYFQDGALAGWAVGGSATPSPVRTAKGIGIGSSRSELESAYSAQVFDSTLGTEFSAGELAGILDGTGRTAKITHLWAGASCTMR